MKKITDYKTWDFNDIKTGFRYHIIAKTKSDAFSVFIYLLIHNEKL